VTTRTLSGGCLCGSVRYRMEGAPRMVSNCHCSLCRRASGAPFVTWLTVRRESFHQVHGTLEHYASSDHGWRAHCSKCGTQVTSGSSRYDGYVEVTAATLDHPALAVPERHTFWPDRLPWVRCEDGLPRHVGNAKSPLVTE
jgi:hypothetical protein